MLIPKPKFSRLAQDAVAELARDGISCTPDEILWLHEMAEGIVRFSLNDPEQYLDLPIPCGNILLYPMSIGAKQWFKSVEDWFIGNARLHALAQAYALAHGRAPEQLLSIRTRAGAVWKILLWSRTLNCSIAELNRAILKITARDEWVEIKTPKEEKAEKDGQTAPRSKSDWGDILARLEHFYPGHSLSYWLWELSDESVAVFLDRSNSFLPIEQQISREDKEFREHTEFRLVIKHIRASRQVGQRLVPPVPKPQGEEKLQSEPPDVPAKSASAPQRIECPRKMNKDNRPDHSGGTGPDKDRRSQKNNSGKKPAAHDLPAAGNQEGTNEGS
jgi:hypothetical protein